MFDFDDLLRGSAIGWLVSLVLAVVWGIVYLAYTHPEYKGALMILAGLILTAGVFGFVRLFQALERQSKVNREKVLSRR